MKLLLVVFVMATSGLALGSTPRFDNSRLFISLKDNAKLPSSNLIKSAKHLFANHYLVQTTSAVKLQRVLAKNTNVLATEKNYYAGKRELPTPNFNKNGDDEEEIEWFDYKSFNDPLVGRIWSFNDSDANGVSVDKTYLSPLRRPEEDIIVAVVDTGVDYNHEDLKNVMWRNEKEIPGNGIDDDNNGYVDDVYGIDTLEKNADGSATGDPMASHAHGTHVAGTIAAEQNNGIGIAGIASRVKIMAIRTVPDNADETDADVVESFLYAARHGAKLINCSFGKNHNEGGGIVDTTIDWIGTKHGVLVVAAAGNDYGRDIDSRRTFPASFDSDYLMVIASTNKRGSLSFFSNIGPKNVDVAAPGSSIYSTVPGNRYQNMSGTSMATPTAVGVAAEVLSNFPELSPLQLKKVLMKSATPVKRFQGKMVSEGRVDLYNALQYTLINFPKL